MEHYFKHFSQKALLEFRPGLTEENKAVVVYEDDPLDGELFEFDLDDLQDLINWAKERQEHIIENIKAP